MVGLLNEVALCYLESNELLGRIFYELNQRNLAVEIICFESVRHGNANLFHIHGGHRQYFGIPKALFAYATQVSIEAGFDGVLVFRAKNTESLDYYQQEFGACQIGAYDPFRLVIWEYTEERLIAEYRRDTDA